MQIAIFTSSRYLCPVNELHVIALCDKFWWTCMHVPDLRWDGVKGVACCLLRIQRLSVCLWSDRIRQDVHHDGRPSGKWFCSL